MARIGQRLRDARTAKSISLERVAEDTNIGLRYLTGLENDDHSAFPGEPYVVGFMRNYAEYLGLDGVA
ncbi:MAG: helix-turn-helix domain-containing protein, partial [Rectinema sp.]